jgi:hypothetical protein
MNGKSRTAACFALLAVAALGGARAETPPRPYVATPVGDCGHCARAQPGDGDRISRLVVRHRQGGEALAKAIQALLQRDACAISHVIGAADKAANKEQKLALQLGVAQALAAMKDKDATGAQTIKCYLDANASDPVVAEILAASGAVAGGGSAGGGGGGAGGGAGGGGFMGGGGTTVSVQ